MGAWRRGQIQEALAALDFQELVHILAYKHFIAKIELEPGEIEHANSDIVEDRKVFQLALRDIIKRFKIRNSEDQFLHDLLRFAARDLAVKGGHF